MEVRVTIAQRMTRIRNVHHWRCQARRQSAMVTIASPAYHQVLRPGTMYSSACQETSCCFLAINSL